MLFKENDQARRKRNPRRERNVRSSTHGINGRNEVECTPDDARFCSQRPSLLYNRSLLSVVVSPWESYVSSALSRTRGDTPGTTERGLI
jgi:hypothetical protein